MAWLVDMLRPSFVCGAMCSYTIPLHILVHVHIASNIHVHIFHREEHAFSTWTTCFTCRAQAFELSCTCILHIEHTHFVPGPHEFRTQSAHVRVHAHVFCTWGTRILLNKHTCFTHKTRYTLSLVGTVRTCMYLL